MDFLLEIGCEEIPALWIEPALEQLKEEAYSFLENERLIPKSIKTYGTPRRLALIINGLPERQKDREKETIGPPATSSASGFAKACGVSEIELFVKEVKGKMYYSLIKKEKGQVSKKILERILPDLIKGLKFPKSMRWKTEFTFARPIRWIVAILDKEIVKCEIAGVVSCNCTRGLRSEPIIIPSPSTYVSLLKKNGVIVDYKERKGFILKRIKEEGDMCGAKPYLPKELLSQITNLVEAPVIIKCGFNKRFLHLPDDVLITAMIHHQRYVPLVKVKGQESGVGSQEGMMPYFLVVSNGGENAMEIIKKGHERVISARLSDAEFFFKEDCKIPMEKFADKLKGVVFHKGLGSLYDKTMRNVAFSTSLALRLIPEREIPDVSKAAFLCKVDLTSLMVQEFPELQGIMGYHYAIKQGIPKKIAIVSKEHYSILPKSLLGRIVHVADRMDTLTGYFSLGIIGKGDSDPYGLRRCGNSIIKIILSSNFKRKIMIESLIRESCRMYKIMDEDKITETLLLFMKQRLESMFREEYPQDVISAVLLSGFDDIIDVRERIRALSFFVKDPDFNNLTASFKRSVNILKGLEDYGFDENFLLEDSEKRLYLSIIEARKGLHNAISKKDYKAGFKILSSLKPDIDKFFDDVLVMADDENIRKNRLSLLFLLKDLFLTLADISVLKVVSI